MLQGDQIIHIALAFDQNFITPFYVLLTSIFKNNRSNTLAFHVIASGVGTEERNSIKEFVASEKATIEFYDFELDSKCNFVIPEGSYYTQATYYRLFFPSLVQHKVNKLLYIDTDTIVVGNLKELYSIDLAHMPVAAVPDSGVYGFKEVGTYFNAGVLLINIPEWLKQEISEKSFKYLQDYPNKITYADQDALNAVLESNWKKISNQFNFTFNDIPIYFSRKELSEHVKKLVVIHYTGVDKPWSVTCANRLRYLYFQYLRQSPPSIAERNAADWSQIKNNLPRYLKVRLIEQLSKFPMLFHIVYQRKMNNIF